MISDSIYIYIYIYISKGPLGRSEKNTLKVFNKTSSQNTFLFPFGCTELTIICVLKGYETYNVCDATNKFTHSSTVRLLQKEETEKAFHKFESVVLGEKALHCSIIQNGQMSLEVVYF